MSDRAITADLLVRLERHYIKPGDNLRGGVFLPEVTMGGAGGPRADALYVGFTSTSGRLLVGHEIKASRADWLRELDHSGKADAWADQCHAWYVVAPQGIVRPGELPASWGLLTPGRSTTRMTIETGAEVHAGRVPSWTAVRSIIARHDTLRANEIYAARYAAQQVVEQKVAQQVAELRASCAADRPDDQASTLLAAVQEALGLDLALHVWGDGRITPEELNGALGRYVRADRDVQRAARDLGRRYQDDLNAIRRRTERVAETLTHLAAITAGEATTTAGGAL
jgi:hypothetical protein